MKIRNLEAQYDNLHPSYVLPLSKDNPEEFDRSLYIADIDPKYQELWAYALKLEQALQKSRDKTNMYRREVQVINKAMWRKHTMLQPVKWLARIVRWWCNVFES